MGTKATPTTTTNRQTNKQNGSACEAGYLAVELLATGATDDKQQTNKMVLLVRPAASHWSC